MMKYFREFLRDLYDGSTGLIVAVLVVVVVVVVVVFSCKGLVYIDTVTVVIQL